MVKGNMRGSELIISPDGRLYHIDMARSCRPPRNIFMMGDPGRVNAFSEHLSDVRPIANNREYVTVFGRYKDMSVVVTSKETMNEATDVMGMGTGIGTDNTEIASVELHALHEFDHETQTWCEPVKLNMMRLGTAASSQKDVALGTIAISTHGIGLDNTGIYYPYFSTDVVTLGLKTKLRAEVAKAIMDSDLAKICPSALRIVNCGELDSKSIKLDLINDFRPYVSTATPAVVQALRASCEGRGLVEGAGYVVGATTSAPGFYGPQGRQIGRLNILIPRLQEILAELSFGGVRVVNNEMESSALFRINGEILGYNVGTACLVIANRAEGEFITEQEFNDGVHRTISVGLEAMATLDRQLQ